jgi:hypothetical protein
VPDGAQQDFVIERFRQEFDSAGLHRLDCLRYIAVTCNEDDRHVGAQYLYVTKKQLEHLNAIEVGKEVFLSCFYASQGGDCWALRTEDGLIYVPWMHERSNEGVEWLKKLYAISGR